MDFTGSIIREFNSLPLLWWVWLITVGTVVAIICKARKMTKKKTIWISILAEYVLFILFVTVIGRNHVEMNAKWQLFWSYSKVEYRTEIILNYILFIPLGFLLYRVYGSKFGLRVVYIGLGLSLLVEFYQLLAHIGLFEFDDIFGNTIGCFLGAFGGRLVINAVRSYSNHY